MSRFGDMLIQVLGDEIEYQPGYFVWQMEREIRDQFVSILDAAKKVSEMGDDE